MKKLEDAEARNPLLGNCFGRFDGVAQQQTDQAIKSLVANGRAAVYVANMANAADVAGEECMAHFSNS